MVVSTAPTLAADTTLWRSHGSPSLGLRQRASSRRRCSGRHRRPPRLRRPAAICASSELRLVVVTHHVEVVLGRRVALPSFLQATEHRRGPQAISEPCEAWRRSEC